MSLRIPVTYDVVTFQHKSHLRPAGNGTAETLVSLTKLFINSFVQKFSFITTNLSSLQNLLLEVARPYIIINFFIRCSCMNFKHRTFWSSIIGLYQHLFMRWKIVTSGPFLQKVLFINDTDSFQAWHQKNGTFAWIWDAKVYRLCFL